MRQKPTIASPARTDQVVAAVRTLFRRYGYRRTSVDEIAREAGLSKATLYLAFAAKEDMFRAMLRQFRAEVLGRCAAAEALDAPVERRVAAFIHAAYGTALEWFGDAAHISELKSVAAEHMLSGFEGDDQSHFRKRLESILDTAEQAGEIDLAARGTSSREVALVLIFAAHGAKQSQRDGAEGYGATLDAIARLVVTPLKPGGKP